MNYTVKFTHRGINLGDGTRQEKINQYIQQMGGTGPLLDYILLNLKIELDHSVEINTIE